MPTTYEKRAFVKWAGKDGQDTSWGSWRAPETPYPIGTSEAEQLKSIIETLQALPRYSELEAEAKATDTLVTTPLCQMANARAFLENTAHQTVSVATKGGNDAYPAQNWGLRIGTLSNLYQRLLDGYSVSYALCDRYGQYIRRGPLWYAADGIIIDCDEFRTPEKPDRPEPVYSRDAFFEQYPQLLEYASFLMPSTRSLLEGKPFKARAVIPFPETVTDKRLFHAIGDYLCALFGFLPKNVTKNPIAVAFGAKHQSLYAWRGDGIFPSDVLQRIKQQVIDKEKQRKREAEEREKIRLQREQGRLKNAELREELKARGFEVSGSEMQESISTFIKTVDPVAEMQKLGWLTHNHGDEYHWVGSSVGRSCEIVEGKIKIFSGTMAAASPDNANEPVNAHRFLLYNLYELDITKDSDKRALRCRLADDGYGTHPDVWEAEQERLRSTAVAEGLLDAADITPQKPVKLSFEGISAELVESLDEAESFIKEVFEKDTSGKIFGLRVDTGTGKTELAIVLQGARPILLTGSHALGQEIYNRCLLSGRAAFLYRGVMHNPDGEFPAESPCITPVLFESIRSKGANPYQHACGICDLKMTCESYGYLSQRKQLQDPNTLMILAIPQLFIDPVYRPFLKEILKLTADDLVLVDDASIENLFLDEEIPLERFRQLAIDWAGEPLGDFAIEIATALATLEGETLIARIQAIVTDVDAPTVNAQLARVRLVDGTITDIDTAIVDGRLPIGTDKDVAKLPRQDAKHWTLLDRLTTFFKAYPKPATAPMRYFEEKLVFSLPPQPFQTDAVLGFMGATLTHSLFTKVFPGTDFYDAAATAWHPEARVFQLRTNRNPRATLLDKETGELSRTGQEYWGYFQQSVEVNPEKHGLISYQKLVEQKTPELEGIAAAWFHNVEGLDTRFKNVDMLHILGAPERKPEDVEWFVKCLGISVEELGKHQVISELVQSVGRGRLVRFAKFIVLWTSHFLPGVTVRAVLFDERDWKRTGGDLSKLEGVVRAREAQERQAQETIETGNVQTVSETAGVSERTARRRTEKQRKENKAARDAAVFRRYDAGETQQTIATQLGIGLATVNRILKTRSF